MQITGARVSGDLEVDEIFSLIDQHTKNFQYPNKIEQTPLTVITILTFDL